MLWPSQNFHMYKSTTIIKCFISMFLSLHAIEDEIRNFCAISSARNQDQLNPKIPEKILLQRYLLSDFHLKLIDMNLCLDNTT